MRTLAVAVALGLLAVPAHAHDDDPFHEGREAADRLSFSAVVRVQWREGARERESTVRVKADRGQVHIDGPNEVVAQAETWTRLWTGAAPPPVELKYDLLRAGEATIAGRAASSVEVWEGDALRERVALDRETGLVLHREQLDVAGRPVRVVTVQQLDLGSPPRVAGGHRPPRGRSVSPAALPRPYRTPAALAGGYRQVGAYRDGALVQVLYSDGLHGISVFAQPGRASDDDGEAVRMGRREGRRFAWPGGEAVTWQAGGLVYTVVGDGPREELVAAASSLPGPPSLSVLGRLKRSCRAMAELLSG